MFFILEEPVSVKSEPHSPSQQSHSSQSGASEPVKTENNEQSNSSTKTPQQTNLPLVIKAPEVKNRITFSPDELRHALSPTLQRLYQQDPESMPFRQPVDEIALNIPDYYDVIKKPMDMSLIKRNLDTGKYTDPWEYVDDIWLMFDNAWLYNRKTSRVYKFCSKVGKQISLRLG